MRNQCREDLCKRPVNGRDLCRYHYQSWMRSLRSDVDDFDALGIRKCGIEDCTRAVEASDLCSVHYKRQSRGMDLEAPVRSFDPERGCQSDGCQNPHHARGYCKVCFKRLFLKEYNALSSHERRAKKQESTVNDSAKKFTHSDRCSYCGTRADSWHIEHKRPISRGGSHTLDNLTTSCPSCNLSKGTRTLEEFAVDRMGWEIDPVFGPIIVIGKRVRALTHTYIQDLWIQVALQAIREER